MRNGMYNITLFSLTAPVAETGDAITVTVMHGEGIAGSITVTLTAAEIDSQRAMGGCVNLHQSRIRGL